MDFFDILLAKQLEGGGGGDVTIEQLDVTENGTYTAPEGKAYTPVVVNVSGYKIKDIPNTPTAIATFNASALPMPSLKVGIEPIQEGSGDPSPENVRPIRGWTECNLSDVSVNLFDKSKAIDGKKINSATGQILNNYTWAMSDYISVPQNTTLYTNANGTGQDYVVTLYDKEKNYIGYKSITSNASFSTDNAYFVILSTIKDKMSVDEMVLNYPATDTNYHAYNGHTYTIPFTDSQGNPITVYGGKLDVVSGVLTVDRVYADFGDLTWTKITNERGDLFATSGLPNIKTPDNSICSQYKFENPYGSNDDAIFYAYQGSTSCNILVRDSRYTDATAFKTAMNGVQLVYELATPQTYQLNPTLVKSLLNTNNVWADTGDVLEGSYFKEL